MDMQLILEQHAGLVLDRQQYLAGLLGSHEWGADTESGLFFFDGPSIETTFEILGTVSKNSKEWLWGWANASLPGDLTKIARKLRDIGRSEGPDLFSEERFTPGDADIHALGVAACGIGGACAYYFADYGDGALLAAFPDGHFMAEWQPDHARALTVIPRLIQLFELDHKAALEHYLTALGYDIRHENGITATRGTDSLTAEFDSLNRLTNLKGSLSS